MDRLEVGGIVVRCAVVRHPLLGEAHVIEHGGRAITAMSVVDWDHPTQIPTVAEPSRLPPGSGGALLNALARLAGARALRYAGPYPTPALYRTLLRSFRASADEAAFTADLVGRALRLARDELPIDFAPAPHDRIDNAHGFVEVRDGIERAVVGGVAFERDGSPGRLVGPRSPVFAGSLHFGHACEIWFGDAPWARIAELDGHGNLVDGPHPSPAIVDDVVGRTFPPALRAALAELVAEIVPAPLAADARDRIATRPLAWADLGMRAARRAGDGFEVHAALWQRIAPLGLARLALALAEALGPIVTRAILAELGASMAR